MTDFHAQRITTIELHVDSTTVLEIVGSDELFILFVFIMQTVEKITGRAFQLIIK